MKFGTFKGVFVPSTEAILGTVLFLLLPTLVGDVGLIPILCVILLAHTVTIATSFSLSDCATNLNTIGGGGMYALSRQSLGKAFGGSIGIQLYIAQAASIGFYCIGFAEPLQPVITPLLKSISLFNDIGPEAILKQKQVLASLIYLVFFIFAIIGANFTLKIQSAIFVILFASIVMIFISPFVGLTFQNQPISSGTINLFGNRPLTISIFFLTFTQFFPAVTGIDAGVGMSGDLKNPKKSLVRGTFTAIAVTLCVYIAAAYIFALIKKEFLVTGYISQNPTGNLLTDILGFNRSFPHNIAGIMVLTGILFATSSSALSCFMTAPRTLQSLTRDKALPSFLNFLGNDFSSKGDEPRFATLVTFFLGMSIIWIGNINMAATIVGICFLIVYTWVNGSAFLERISGNPTFRPTSKGHWFISFYGLISSITAIILFNWIIGIIIFATQFIIFRLILKYKAKGKLEGVWWGVLFSVLRNGLAALNRIVMGTKNWRPILTAITSTDKNNSHRTIAFLAEIIASYKGMVSLVIFNSKKDAVEKVIPENFKIPTTIIRTTDRTSSILSIIQLPLAGEIRVNSVLLEYSKDIDNVAIIKEIISLNKNILLLNNGEKYKKSERLDIWWRGEKNGNFMVLLAYIMNSALTSEEKMQFKIRIIRILEEDESEDTATKEIMRLLSKARLSGEVVIIPHSERLFEDVLIDISSEADLVMMGIPGNYIEKENARFFSLKEYFFEKEIDKYNDMPCILFVKSVNIINLIED